VGKHLGVPLKKKKQARWRNARTEANHGVVLQFRGTVLARGMKQCIDVLGSGRDAGGVFRKLNLFQLRDHPDEKKGLVAELGSR